MILDFHTHTFPDRIAKKALIKLSADTELRPRTDGTRDGLSLSIKAAGIDYALVLPIATNPRQTENINATAVEINRTTEKSGLMSFGSLHPDNENYKDIIDGLAAAGIKGIKFHPVFQGAYIDDDRFLQIIEYADKKGLIIITHAGFDVGFPGVDYVSVKHIYSMMKALHPKKMVLAHMGGWMEWDDVLSLLLTDTSIRKGLYFDTAFSLLPDDLSEIPLKDADHFLKKDKFCELVRAIGADRVMFGTDSPWADHTASLKYIKSSGLSPDELDKIFYNNAAKLLGL